MEALARGFAHLRHGGFLRSGARPGARRIDRRVIRAREAGPPLRGDGFGRLFEGVGQGLERWALCTIRHQEQPAAAIRPVYAAPCGLHDFPAVALCPGKPLLADWIFGADIGLIGKHMPPMHRIPPDRCMVLVRHAVIETALRIWPTRVRRLQAGRIDELKGSGNFAHMATGQINIFRHRQDDEMIGRIGPDVSEIPVATCLAGRHQLGIGPIEPNLQGFLAPFLGGAVEPPGGDPKEVPRLVAELPGCVREVAESRRLRGTIQGFAMLDAFVALDRLGEALDAVDGRRPNGLLRHAILQPVSKRRPPTASRARETWKSHHRGSAACSFAPGGRQAPALEPASILSRIRKKGKSGALRLAWAGRSASAASCVNGLAVIFDLEPDHRIGIHQQYG